MYTLRVIFLAARLPRIPSYMVLFVLGFCDVKHRDCVLSLSRSSGLRVHPISVCSTFFWICCQSRIVRKCRRQFFDSNREDSENSTFGLVSHNSNNSTLPILTDHLFRMIAEWVVDDIVLQIGMKCFSLKMIFDLFDELLIANNFFSFHNCMWQSRQNTMMSVSYSSTFTGDRSC